MNEYLYIFGFEGPLQRLQNERHGWDHEDSYAFFVLAESPEEALEWGREVSEAFCRYIYQESGWAQALPSWKDDGYGHWIEEDPEEIALARKWGCPRIAEGEMPDFATWPDVI
jgi:hypothetical protein